jgi:phosphatidate cytidylyltransferase
VEEPERPHSENGEEQNEEHAPSLLDTDDDPPTFDFGTKAKEPEADLERAEETMIEGLEAEQHAEDEAADEGAEPEGEQPARRPPGVLTLLRSETFRRVLWAAPWVIFAIAIVVIGGLPFTLAMIGLGCLGLREFFRMTARARPLATPAYLTLAAILLAAHLGDSFQVVLVAAAGFPVLFGFAAARDERGGVTLSFALTVFGVAWMGLGFAHAVLLRDLPTHGGALLVDVLVATFVGDTAAYGGGRLFGSRKITPRISPNKTLEGLIGGFIGATMGFWFAGLYQDWLTGVDALVMGAAIGALAPIGDLFASMIKRDCEVKDTGRLFGPHGGLIDRLDAVLFTVVAGYYLSVAFVY